MLKKIIGLVSFLVGTQFILVEAQVFSNKGAELPLQVIATPHFDVVHNVSLENYARKVAAAAEYVYSKVVAVTGNQPGRTTILVGDETDIFNGYALPGPDPFIRVYATFPRPEDIGLQWEDEAITLVGHEFLHVSHLTTREGLRELARSIFGPIPGLTDARVPPAWFVEGYAVYLESKITAGGRSRDASIKTLRAQMARADNWPSLSDAGIGTFEEWPFGNTRYAFGSGFMPFLIERFGEEGIRQAIQAYNQLFVSFDDAWQSVHKISLAELWDQWQKEEKIRAESEKKELEKTGLPNGELIDFARSSRAPAWHGDLVAWWQGGAINIGDKSYKLPARPDRLSWTNDGRLVYSRSTADGGNITGEVYQLVAGKEVKLTKNAHARDAIADGECIIYVRDVVERSSLIRFCQNDEKEIFVAPKNWHIFQPMPGEKGIALSIWRPGGFLDIAVLTDRLEFITSDPAQDIWPIWYNDQLVFSSDRSGDFQSYRFENDKIYQLTANPGGVYASSFDSKAHFYFSGYAKDGYELRKIDKLPTGLAINLTKSEPKVIDELNGDEFPVKPYQPRLLPIIWYPFGLSGLGVTVLGVDPVGVIGYQLTADLPVVSSIGPSIDLFINFRPNLVWNLGLEAQVSDNWSAKFSPSYHGKSEYLGPRFDYQLIPWVSIDENGVILGVNSQIDALDRDEFGYSLDGLSLSAAFNSRAEINIATQLTTPIFNLPFTLNANLFANRKKSQIDLNFSTHFSIPLEWRINDGAFALEKLTFAPFIGLERGNSFNFGAGSQIWLDTIFNYYAPISLGLEFSYWSDGFRFGFLTSVPLLSKLQ